MTDKNDRKNDKVTPMGERGVKFSKDYQPSPEAKKEGWEERRARLRGFDILDKYMITTYGQLKRLMEDMRINEDDYTVQEIQSMRYVSDPKNFPDYLDRMGVRTKARIDITSDDEKLELTTINLLSDLLDGITNIRKEGSEGADKNDIQE